MSGDYYCAFPLNSGDWNVFVCPRAWWDEMKCIPDFGDDVDRPALFSNLPAGLFENRSCEFVAPAEWEDGRQDFPVHRRPWRTIGELQDNLEGLGFAHNDQMLALTMRAAEARPHRDRRPA